MRMFIQCRFLYEYISCFLPGNILRYNNGQNFSTPDRDHDNNTQLNCGSLYQSGWWHNQCSPTPSVNSDCLSSNLNGRYSADTSTSSFWATWDCTRVYLTGSEMKFRPMQPTDGYQQQVVEVRLRNCTFHTYLINTIYSCLDLSD